MIESKKRYQHTVKAVAVADTILYAICKTAHLHNTCKPCKCTADGHYLCVILFRIYATILRCFYAASQYTDLISESCFLHYDPIEQDANQYNKNGVTEHGAFKNPWDPLVLCNRFCLGSRASGLQHRRDDPDMR